MRDADGNTISIIVPVYNVEKCIEKCLDSIKKQSYKNFEVVLVDDGSSDKSAIICDRYAMSDNRFKVIHQRNCGVAHARNVGLDAISGDFVTFVDSDDELGERFLEKMVDPLINDSSIDVVLGRIVYIRRGVHRVTSPPQMPRIIDRIEAIRSLVNIKYGRWNMCAKLYRCSCVQGTRLDESLCLGEDLDWNWKVFRSINKAMYVNVEEYFYLWRDSSLTNAGLPYEELAKHHRNYSKLMKDDIVLKNTMLQLDMNYRFVSDFYNYFKMHFFYGDDLTQYYYEFRDLFLKAVDMISCDFFKSKIQEQFLLTYEEFVAYHDEMCSRLRSSNNVYIYGAGRNAKSISEYFYNNDISFRGFVVSDGEKKDNSPDGKHDVIEFSDVKKWSEATVFLAMILPNAVEVLPNINNVNVREILF